MFLRLYDGHSINMDDIRCIIPVSKGNYSKSDRLFIDEIKNDKRLGFIMNWTKGKAQKSAIVTSGTQNKLIIYITSMSPDLIQNRIDEYQNVKRKYQGADFSKTEIDKDLKKG